MAEVQSENPLSERELQILQLVATGASNQDIAREFVISINTVKVHMRNIFEKLAVQSRGEAVHRASQEGWIGLAGENELSPGPPLRTFLLTAQSAPILSRWQQLYLAGAFILTLFILTTPFLSRAETGQTPYLPVLISSSKNFYEPAAPPLSLVAPAEEPSRWTSRSPMTTFRAGLGAVAYDDKLYAIGGVKNSDKATRFVEIYDPVTNSWSEGSTKLTAVANIAGAVIHDQIYVPGGCTNDRQATDRLEIYSPQADTWSRGKALPAPRCGYGLVALGEQLYLFGGWDGNTYQNTIFVYSVELDQWQVLATTLPQAMGYMGVAVLEDTIYLAGGYNGQAESARTYAFQPVTATWSEKASMQEGRAGLGLISAANSLYAIGGGWEHALQSNEKYDPQTNTWSPIETPFTYRWRNLGVALIDTEIFAVGGWNGTENEYMADLISYNVTYQLFLPFFGN